MAISLRPQELISRFIRTNTAEGITGSNMIENISGALNAPSRELDNPFTADLVPDERGILEKFFDFGKSLVGFATNLLSAVGISITSVTEWIFAQVESLKQFDWNATDKELKERMKSQNLQLASLWGGFLGQGAGWLAGIAAGAVVGYVCPVIGGAALSRIIAGQTSLEAIEELAGEFQNVFFQTSSIFASQALTNLYMNYRNLLKRAPRSLLESIYGSETTDFIKNTWGEEGEPVISFNKTMDEAVESIRNPYTQAFLEEFLEESWDSFTEAGILIAQELDFAFAQQNQAQEEMLGMERSVEIDLDRNGSDESIYYLDTPQNLLIPQIQSDINNHRLIHNRDIGGIIGEPYSTFTRRAFPMLRSLTIEFRDKPRPPWVDKDTGKIKQAQTSIPDFKRGVTWDKIKAAAKPFTWGAYRATAQLDNGRNTSVYGATKQEAERTLKRLLTLSEAQILKISVSESEYNNPRMRKEPTRMYPAYATVLFRRNSVNGQGRADLRGQSFDEETERIALYTDFEPENAEILARA